jgi:VanZ family protein
MLFRVETLPRWLRDFLPLVLWMLLIFVLSSQPRLIDIDNEAGEKFFFKSAHIIVYGILAWLWWRTLAPQRHIGWAVLFMAFALTMLYGISDEFHQSFVSGRHGRLADVLFDAGGALAMILLIRWIKWLRFWPDSLNFSLNGNFNRRT